MSRRPAEQIAVSQPRNTAALPIIALVMVAGVGIRMLHLDTRPFWVDEAESSINALTILQHGYPTDSYLGIPIYENTHVWFWHDNPEYEFRDVSYSDRGFAVYHGWLPLYAIAASFALHGIAPDLSDDSRSTKHNVTEQKRWTRAARLPAVLFAAIFLLTTFIGGRALYGRDAGWAALIIAAIHPYHLQISDQARYYSAQVTLTTACCVLLWLVINECRWKHVWMAAALYVLLFHTHLLSFLTALVMLVLTTPLIIYLHRDWFRKMTVFAAVLVTGTLPWILMTGFYDHQSRIPRAWELLQMPSDLLRYPPFNWRYAVVGLILFGIIVWINRSGRLSAERSATVRQLGPVFVFLAGWATVGYTMFVLFMPAVSFTLSRLNLSYWGPLFLLFAATSAMVIRTLTPSRLQRFSSILTAVLMLVIFVAAQVPVHGRVDSSIHNEVRPTWPTIRFVDRPGSGSWEMYAEVFQQLDSMHLDAGARIYSAPNAHLVLTVYSGLPIQDITPVRKSFLDSYKGEIIYIDVGIVTDTGLLAPELIQKTALANGYSLSTAAAEKASVLLYTRDYREAMTKALAPGQPDDLEPIPPYLQPLVKAHQARVVSNFAEAGYDLVTRGFEIHGWSDWVAVLKYRFVEPKGRRAGQANYVQRLRGAEAMILVRSWPVAIFRSRWHPQMASARPKFMFIQ